MYAREKCIFFLLPEGWAWWPGLCDLYLSKSVMEIYDVLDFKSGDLLFATKEHNPPSNVHAEKKSHAEIKAAVLRSPRIKKTIRDVSE